MTGQAVARRQSIRKSMVWGICLILLLGIGLAWPEHTANAAKFVAWGLIDVAPIVIPGILLAAWIIASSADALIAGAFEGRTLRTVVAASLIGAITPVCGVSVLPLMAGLLAAGVPLAPIMAFWLSSPITDPAMLATTAATLGLSFAIGKTIAAFGLGLFGGVITGLFTKAPWALNALRDNGLTRQLSATRCGAAQTFDPKVWGTEERRRSFNTQFRATMRLILICLIPAFTAEYALNAALTPGALAAYVGEDQWWAIPAAVFVGAPAYIDGYAALPLTRGLIDNGMSEGAAMAFLISGGVVSIWGAMAIAPVLKLKPFLLYLLLAVLGSLAAGYVFGWAA
ncbi:permease [Aquicoccus porphyridii]|uniref:Permease n=1 Tax=Aquicoccus porphyridii TaxID=1852029 RepID=A0A5A9YX93_9RHOB|nr:permease [Aquicoccus porphyridii]KAA0909465.1 permease [Aquicoccus porphyridii]RAI51781.1 permease [Rhodobacteraceae bacterium AsT-22]